MTLYVDYRWSGNHGIGRWSSEVLSRLEVPHKPLAVSSRPLGTRDLFSYSRLRMSRSDIVFSPGFNASLSLASQLLTVHDLIHLHDQGERSGSKRFYYDFAVKPAILRTGKVLTVSESSRSDILEWLGSSRVDVINVGNGCSSEFKRQGIYTRFDRPTFMYVGNAKPHKNVISILNGLALRPEYRLTVVAGRDSKAILSYAAKMGVATQIQCYQNLSDEQLAELYRGASALLMPSRFEGFGLPVVESLACGTPVGYWVGCNSVAELGEGCGIGVHDSYSSAEWANCMDSLISYGQISPDSSEFVSRKYNWDSVARVVDEALKELI